jgi:KTSC domain
MATRDAYGRFATSVLSDFLSDAESQMRWQPVSSSNVAAVGFNPAINVLGVRFLNGSEYHYYDVPEDIAQSLESASSVGGFLHAFVKGHYAYERVS